jgi:hypothetical protein
MNKFNFLTKILFLKFTHTKSNCNYNLFKTTKYFFAEKEKVQPKKGMEKEPSQTSIDKTQQQSPKTTDEIPPYRDMDTLVKKDFVRSVIDSKQENIYYYGSSKRKENQRKYAQTEFLARRMRQSYLQSGDFSTNKHMIPIKRLRKEGESLFKLMQNGELAGVIEGREEFDDINFVVDKTYVKHLEGYLIMILFILLKNLTLENLYMKQSLIILQLEARKLDVL